MFLLLQMWTGGWTSDPGPSTPDVLETQVDYVSVWQRRLLGGMVGRKSHWHHAPRKYRSHERECQCHSQTAARAARRRT